MKLLGFFCWFQVRFKDGNISLKRNMDRKGLEGKNLPRQIHHYSDLGLFLLNNFTY